MQTKPKFLIHNFVRADELLPLLPYLPNEAIAQEELEKLHGFSVAIPRDVGRPITSQMAKFWDDADVIYQKSFERLDSAHEILAHPERFSYATLEQISDKLLSKATQVERGKDGKFPMHALYAVHRKILGEDIGFQPQVIQVIRSGQLYEIVSKAEVLSIHKVMDLVRKYRTASSSKKYSTCASYVDFIQRARRRIDFSRTFRDFTPSGTVGPSRIQSEEAGEHYRYGRKGEPWADDDFAFLDFMESWACLDNFNRGSIMAGIGSEILRALARYSNVELDASTAFTFLKEVGMIPPWEVKAAYTLRLPYTGRRLGVEYGYTPHTGYTADKLAHLRKDWENLPVYCIDSSEASEIDDGLSIEATDNPDETWIHVHVADPAAHMDPKGAASQYAEYVTETIYFPERRVPMLHQEKVSQDLSLAPGRPCLTFSSKINQAGIIMDTAITPGIIRNVVYIEPGVVQGITSGVPAEKYTTYGEESSSHLSRRLLSDMDSLSESQRSDLHKLFQYCTARTNRLRTKGAVTVRPRRAMVHVSFDGAPWAKPKPGYSYWHYGDPKIAIRAPPVHTGTTNEMDVVSTCMLLAGECAARWSNERGLPIIYRVTPQHPDKDPSKFYNENVKPYRDRDEEIPIEITREYFTTIGRIVPSTVAGPHMGIGVEAMTRTTSPLRRYADLITMWQIEAALIEEARTGESLIGNTRDDFLPFTKEKLDSMLPRISSREKLINQMGARAERSWSLQFLLYAWKFGKYCKLPSPLHYVVRSVAPTKRVPSTGGSSVELCIGGAMDVPSWLNKEDVKPDDIFEVEIMTIDISNAVLQYRAIRRVETEGRAVSESALDDVPLIETSEPSTSEALSYATA